MDVDLRAALALLALAGVLGCGGRLRGIGDGGDVDGGPDAGDAGDAEDDSDLPVVDSVTPSTGPNSGGTPVIVRGSGFVPEGGTQILFANGPASGVDCASSTECRAVTPWEGFQPFAQRLHVQASILGGTRTSRTRDQDLFTYLSGPVCQSALTCPGLYFPELTVTCPSSVSFYLYPLTSSQQLIATGTKFQASTDDAVATVAACVGDPISGSCTLYSLFEASWSYCGGGDFCGQCAQCGGVCGMNASGLTCSVHVGGAGGCGGFGSGG
jgi:hypothetical protein